MGLNFLCLKTTVTFLSTNQEIDIVNVVTFWPIHAQIITIFSLNCVTPTIIGNSSVPSRACTMKSRDHLVNVQKWTRP